MGKEGVLEGDGWGVVYVMGKIGCERKKLNGFDKRDNVGVGRDRLFVYVEFWGYER